MKPNSDVATWRKQNPDLPMLRGMHYGSHSWYRQCGAKRAYFTFASALKAFYEVLPKPCHNKNNAPLTIYRCGWCEWYHLGHLPKRASRGEGTVFSEIRRPDWLPQPTRSHYVGSFAKSNV